MIFVHAVQRFHILIQIFHHNLSGGKVPVCLEGGQDLTVQIQHSHIFIPASVAVARNDHGLPIVDTGAVFLPVSGGGLRGYRVRNLHYHGKNLALFLDAGGKTCSLHQVLGHMSRRAEPPGVCGFHHVHRELVALDQLGHGTL